MSLSYGAPEATGEDDPPLVEVDAGRSVTVDVSEYFTGRVSEYVAESDNTDVVTISVTGVSGGEARITARAVTEGGSAERTFAVTVSVSTPPTVTVVRRRRRRRFQAAWLAWKSSPTMWKLRTN